MKKRDMIRKLLIIFFIFTFVFSVIGIKNVLAEEPLFKLINATIENKSDGVLASITSFDDNELNTDVTFHKVNDYVDYKLTIKNTSSDEYKIVLISDNNASDNIFYEYDYDTNAKFEANSTINITLKATYKTEVTDMSKRVQNTGFKLSITVEDESGNITDGEITVNPKTGDNIRFYVMLCSISLLGLLFVLIAKKKLNKYFVITVLLMPIATKAVTPSFVINLNPSMKLYDKIVINRVVDGEEQEEIISYNTKFERPADPILEGYTFDNWYLDGEVYDFDTILTEDTVLEARFNIVQYTIEYDFADGDASNYITSYNVETDSFDLVTPTKGGYSFSGWTGSNGEALQTRVTIAKGTTGNKFFVAHFSPNDTTSYMVVHKYRKLDSTFEVVEESLQGTTDSIVTPALIPRTGFENPELKELKIIANGDARIEYIYERKTFTLTLNDASYIESNLEAGEYPYETEIILTAKEKEHYNFEKWSNNETNSTYTFKLVSDTEISPVYQPKDYTVSFNAHGGVDVDSITKAYDTEVGELSETVKTNYIFDGWYTTDTYETKVTSSTKVLGDTTYHAKWLKSVALANLSSDNITITRLDTETITVSNVEEEYSFTSSDTSIATVNNNGVVTGIGKGNTKIVITGTISGKTKEITITVNPIYYEVTFNPKGGSSVDSLTVEENTKLDSLPTTTNGDKIFGGWYTQEVGGTKITGDELITGNVEYFVHWRDYICTPATTLHKADCTSTGYCVNAHFSAGEKITFGIVPDSSTMEVGFAYNCNVNNDDEYSETTERFYYLRTVDNKAVLISHSNFEGEDGQKTDNIFLYSDAQEKLPTSADWPIITELFDGKAARFITLDDINAAFGSNTTNTGSLDSYTFLFENTRFISNNTGRTAMWIIKNGNNYIRINTQTRNVATVTNASKNVARPVIEVPIKYVEQVEDVIIDDKYIVKFESNGGAEIEDQLVDKNVAIGELPVPIKDNYDFGGWYSDTGLTNVVTPSTIVESNLTLYAKWIVNTVASIGDINYSSLQAAINAVPTDGTKTTIKLVKDTNEALKINAGKNIEFDLQNYTVSNGSTNTIVNNGTLKITNGTITCSAGSGAINNNSGASLTITGGRIIATGSRQAVYNDGGTLVISGDAYLESSSSERATVQNTTKKNGNITITGGTIISHNQQAVKNENILVIGVSNGTYDATSPILQGKTYGLTTTTDVSIYDGIFKGVTLAIDDTSKIVNKELGAIENNSTEDIDGSTYKTLFYVLDNTKALITFNTDGGSVNPQSMLVDINSAIGELPTPTKGIYTFDGWYAESTFETLITSATVVTASTTYYAKWTYASSDEIVSFNTTNDVMTVYYNNIASWKNDESTFQANMQANFNNYNCKCKDNTCSTSGTVSCDKPKGYDTGIGEKINVYLSNETTKEKGNEVTYTLSDNGVIYNMIPGQVYYWELDSDHSVYGYVKAVSNRRILETGTVGNTRDLGGMKVDVNNDGTYDGTLKYEKLFRGEKVGTSSLGATYLENLGVTEEVDLRASSERASGEVVVGALKQREMKHYQIDREHYPSYYNLTRSVVKEVMQDVVAGKNIYFHCRIGADRTGTIAYILEGLLGVNDEERLEDYELTFFSGLVNRHRFYSTDPTSSVSKTEKFVYMYNFMETNEDIYNWYMLGSEDDESENLLIQNFRNAMIDYYE